MALKIQGGAARPVGAAKPSNVTDAEWNAYFDRGKALIAKGYAPVLGRDFKDSMFHSFEIHTIVEHLTVLALRFPKARPALAAAQRAAQDVDQARKAIDQAVVWD